MSEASPPGSAGKPADVPPEGPAPADGPDAPDTASPDGRAVGAASGRLRALRGPATRRGRALSLAAVLGLALLTVAALLPVPYVRLSPGPTFNTIGSFDGRPLIEISGTTTYPVTGALDMTTVSELGGPSGGLTLVQAVVGWLGSSDAVVPRELLFPDDATAEQVQQDNAVAFSTSQSDAVAAALRHLGRPVKQVVQVAAVAAGSPSDGVLRPGDVLVSIAGTALASADDVSGAVDALRPGTAVPVVVERAGERTTARLTPGESPTQAGRAYLGISFGTAYRAPFTLTFTLSDVGGPSAGMMFALGIVDRLTPGELTGGRHVAGTGTISPEGKVGPIGGIRQKLVGAHGAGAVLFLAPKDNCGEVAGRVPEGLQVVPVSTLSEAVDVLGRYPTDPGSLPTCG